MLGALQVSIVHHLCYFIATSQITMSILWNVHLESLERAPRSPKHYHAKHTGPGIIDDLAFLLDARERAKYGPLELAGHDARFKALFRLSVAASAFPQRRARDVPPLPGGLRTQASLVPRGVSRPPCSRGSGCPT